ncbi:hypothetical protein AB0C93_29000, partial [Streptomyces sp. NPDC048518]
STCVDATTDRVDMRTGSCSAARTDAVTGRDDARIDPPAEQADAPVSTCVDATTDRVDVRTGSCSAARTDAVTGRDGIRIEPSAERADARAATCADADRVDMRTGSCSAARTDAVTGRDDARIDPTGVPAVARAATCADAPADRVDARTDSRSAAVRADAVTGRGDARIEPSAAPADARASACTGAPADRADPRTGRANPRTGQPNPRTAAAPLTDPSASSRTRIAARADELLAALVEEEPSAVCRAVARWARDERACRRFAAALYGPRVAPYASDGPARDLLRHAAFALLARADDTLHGAALALLVHDPRTRSRHLPHALSRFAAGDPLLPATAPVAALLTHSEPVLDAFRTRLLHVPGPVTDETLCALADVTTPALAHRVAALVHDLLERRPEAAGPAAAYVDRRLDHGPAVRSALFPLVTGVLRSRPARVRAALAPVLAAPGTPASRGLRGELFDALLGQERDPDVLESALRAVARAAGEYGEDRIHARVHRIGQLLVRTPEGATRFDRCLVEAARDCPDFAARVIAWLGAAPDAWAALVGPSAGRTIEALAGGVRIPAQGRPVGRSGVTPATCSGASRDPSAWQS